MSASMKLRSVIASLVCAASLAAHAAEVSRPQVVEVQPGELTRALELLAKQFNVEVIYPSKQLQGVRTQGVSGVLDSTAAFQKLIEGTALVVREYQGAYVVMLPVATAATGPELLKVNLVSGVSAATPRYAAEGAGGSVPAEEAGARIEEVTVTARRREETLMETPIAITAYSGEELKLRQIDRTDQLAQSTPNLVFRTSMEGLSDAAIVFIRGIGQGDFVPTVQAGVGTYVDGVYISSVSGALMDTAGVSSIEVLRGPQGTLFGRNTIGGAILVNSVKPDEAFGGQGELTVGDFDRREVKGSINVPFTDTFYGRLSILARDVDGYVDTPNIAGDKGLGADETRAARLALRWVPTDSLTIDLAGDYTSRESSAPPRVLAAVAETRPATPLAAYNSLVAPYYGLAPMTSGSVLPGESYTSLSSFGPPGEADIYGANLTVEWDLGAVTLKSITSYRNQDNYAAIDGDTTPSAVTHREDWLEGDQFTQELQVLGTAFDDRLNYVGGIYYFKEDMVNRNQVLFPTFLIMSGSIVDNYSSAVFGQLSYDLTDRWSITAGYRYSEDNLDSIVDDRIQYIIRVFEPTAPGGQISFPLPPDPAAFRLVTPGTRESDFSGGVPYLNIAHQWDTVMVYGSYSEGYKGGGFSQRIQPGNTITPFGPEEAAVYELGFKWTGFDDRLRLNGAVFKTDYSDLQVSVVSCPTGCVGNAILNASDAEIKGAELELQAALTSRLSLSAGLGYLEGEYKRVESYVSFPATNDLPSIPEWGRNASLTYRWPLAWGQLVMRGDYSFSDSYFTDADNIAEVPSVSLYNAGITFIAPTDNWEIGVQVRNLTDEYYYVGGGAERVALLGQDGFGTLTLAPPRTVSARFSYRF